MAEAKERNYHLSDCSVYNQPALPNGPCDCGLKKNKYTPGPWAKEEGTTLIWVGCDPDLPECSTGIPLIELRERPSMFSMKSPHREITDEEMIANARLISAAPEMYEALKAMVETLENIIEAGDYREDSTLENARQALAKSEGRA